MNSALYKCLRIYNDVKAISKGPKAIVKRYARKVYYRKATSILRKIGL